MISLPGRLSVKKIHGARGEFCVGDLVTEIGEFRVKSTILDQFDEGQYAGRFQVTRIYPNAYTYYGKMVVEIRAEIADLQLDDDGVKDAQTPTVPAEPDPLDERPAAAPAEAPPADKPADLPTAPAADYAEPSESAAAESSAIESAQDEAGAPAEPGTVTTEPAASVAPDPDQELFGEELYAALCEGTAVKLDPTVNRTRFRKQRDRLKARGFRFDATSQTWARAPAQ